MFERRAAVLALAWLSLGLGLTACSPRVDLKQALEIADVSSGWFDAGIEAGKNKLVPSVTFRVRKKADVNLRSVSLNVAFRKVPLPGTSTEEELEEVFVQNVPFAEGNQTAPLTIRTQHGYTGDPPQSRLDMLKHSQFRDVRVHVFAKYSSSQWVELGTIDVQRQLLTR
jgi:hypothetical protein